MAKFKDKSGKIFEVSEEHAEQVIRKQGSYEEVKEEPKAKRTRKKVDNGDDG